MKRAASLASSLGITAAAVQPASLAVLAAVACSCVTGLAAAQNPRSVPIGGRTATMGGAGTAAGNDSAMPYLNPAGLAGVPGDIFAVSATVYGYTSRNYDSYFFPRGTPSTLGPLVIEEEEFITRSVHELPSSVMYFKVLSPPGAHLEQRLGMALVIPRRERLDILASTHGRFPSMNGSVTLIEGVTRESTDYWLGPSYAVRVGDSLRLGLSLFGVYSRTVSSFQSSQRMELAGGASTSAFRGQNATEGNALALTAVGGVQAELTERLWVGAGLALPTTHLTGELSFASESDFVSPDPNTALPVSRMDTSTFQGRYEVGQPLRLNLGVAWDDREAFSVAGDVHLYMPRSDAVVVEGVQSTRSSRSGEVTRSYKHRERLTTDFERVVDLSLGVELALSRLLALRAGGFTDLAQTAEVSPVPDDLRRLRVDRYGASLGVGLTFGSFDSTLGAVASFGSGRYGAADTFSDTALASSTISVIPIEVREQTFMLLLSGAVTTEEAKQTIEDTLPVEVSLPELPGQDTRTAPAPAPSQPPRPAPPAEATP